ncbi:MAG: MFS transporter [Burkholderiales bacterium]
MIRSDDVGARRQREIKKAGYSQVNEQVQSLANQTGKNVVLLAVMLGAFLTPFTGSAINVALPAIGAELSMDAVLMGWVSTAYLLAAAAFLVPFGRLADIVGRKKIFQIGIGIDLVASLLCTVAPSGEWLIAFRALQGFGSALMFASSTAILTAVFPVNERGRALGMNAASAYVGLSVGPLVGGLVTEHFAWQGAFVINAFVDCLITALVWFRFKGEWAEARGEKYDVVGALLCCIGIGILIYAFSSLAEVRGLVLLPAAVVILWVFVRWESRQPLPVMNIAAFRQNPGFILSNLAALASYSATFSSGFLLSLYLQYIGGYSAAYAGLILVIQPVVMVITSPVAGSLSDRVEPRVVASLGMLLTVIGLSMLVFLDANVSLPLVIAAQVVLGAGFGFFSSPNTNSVMSALPAKFRAVASGTLGTMRLTGQALSQGIVVLLLSLFIGRADITPANHGAFLQAMIATFIVSALLCGAGIVASVSRGNRIKH